MPKPFCDLTSKRFGRLVAQWPVGRGDMSANGRGQVYWLCLCDCGTMKHIAAGNLRLGMSRSCGCINRENLRRVSKGNITHGHSPASGQTSTYGSWQKMMDRCFNEKHESYRYYGGNGVTVCEKWRTFEGFLEDMGLRPYGETLGRLGDIGNYEPGNVQWMTSKEQGKNQRLKRARRRLQSQPQIKPSPR